MALESLMNEQAISLALAHPSKATPTLLQTHSNSSQIVTPGGRSRWSHLGVKRETQPEGRGGRNLKLVGRIWDDNCLGRMRGGVKIVLEEALVKIWCSEEAVGVEDGRHCGRDTEMVGNGKAGG